MRRLALVLTLTTLIAATAGPDQKPLSRLTTRDGQFVDGHGRVALLRGANVPAHVFKPIPYGPKDIEALKGFGFNFIRLGISWDKVEPAAGEYDLEYLRSVAAFARLCGEAGIYVMPEVHKFGWCAPGSDVPTWLCDPPVTGGDDFVGMFKNADRFWDDPAVQDKFIALWKLVIAEFKDLDCVIGYNPMNEPLASTMFIPGLFDRKLFAFYDRFIAAIRPLDPDRPIILEPCTANLIIPMVVPPGFKRDNLAYAPHPYYAHQNFGSYFWHEPETDYGQEKKYFRNSLEAKRLGGPLLIGEYGGDPDTRFARHWLLKTWRLQDRYFVGAAIWSYDKSGESWAILNPDYSRREFFDRNLRRPYPRATAGKPVQLKVDAEHRTFVFRWRPDASIAAPTEIFIPAEYMKGKLLVSAGRWRYDEGLELLTVENPEGTGEARVEIK